MGPISKKGKGCRDGKGKRGMGRQGREGKGREEERGRESAVENHLVCWIDQLDR